MNLGKEFRLKRIIDEHGVSIICALDHGMTSPTFLAPLKDMPSRVREAIRGGANVIMMSRGFARLTVDAFHKDTALALLLTASATGSTVPNQVVDIARVEEALRMGADAVVVFVALTGPEEARMIRFVAEVGEACERLGMPFIAEAEYPTTYKKVEELKDEYGFEYLIRNARLCAELGADMVKTNWPGDAESFARIVEATAVPVVLAGGPRISDAELLQRMEEAKRVGAIGCSVGRNIFTHEHPEAMTRALARVIREGWPAAEALAELERAVAERRAQPEADPE
ncbi:MAG: fructose-bisphosphate aldolase [Nitrospinota bacterium]|nr:MAG: fructose-bisphosphate aldolase [Nitrospinota bacterium]